MLRALVLAKIGRAGDAATVKEACHRFDAYVTGESLDADLRSAVYATVLKHGDASYWDKVMTVRLLLVAIGISQLAVLK